MIRALLFSFFCVSLTFGQDAPKPIDPAKKAAIAHLLASMHATDLLNQQMKLMAPSIVSMLKSNPNLTPDFADEFGRRFLSQMNVDAISEIVTQGYADHFSIEEIKDLSAFYDSPAGKKLVEVQPVIMSDVAKKAQAYGQQLGEKIGQDIAKEHPEYVKSNAAGANPPQF